MTALFYFFMPLFLFFCFIMILLVLIQKARGGGLSSAFGDAGNNIAFGSNTGDVLTLATSLVFALFVLFALILNVICNKM